MTGKHSVNVSSSAKPLMYDILGNTDFTAPLGNGLRLSGIGQKSIAASVVGLLLSRRPSAILRGVMPLVVDAIQRFALGLFTHVGQERLETPQPLLTNRDAAPPVVVEVGYTRIGAATNHRFPTAASRTHVANTVWADGPRRIDLSLLIAKATTGARRAFGQVNRLHHLLLSALTTAQPLGAFLRGVVCPLYYRQSGELLSGQVEYV